MLTSRNLIRCFCSFLFVIFCTTTQAAVLATVDVSSGSGGVGTPNADTGAIELVLSVGGLFFENTGNLGTVYFTPTDVGESLILNSGPTFLAALDILTNGQDDIVGIFYRDDPDGNAVTGAGRYQYESDFFFGGSSIDFSGYIINYIEFAVYEVLVEVPGSDPNGDGNWTEITFEADMIVHGSPVPLPAAFMLFSSAILVLGSFRKYSPNRAVI